ncbi:hypothetical protein HYDPIDRAFT_171056 [Hydnomerulius pinastri MD-312]|uniref:Uncharacterized protein n=1 Tax=Hydnomerulius pinastri MD-312 TaxID=994086 RepID=A0A0C9VZJ2_9AGAM|nr:hypothetical protein HYDPIDRAFT_171056 [Hydnomerulius pinastri MD-312]
MDTVLAVPAMGNGSSSSTPATAVAPTALVPSTVVPAPRTYARPLDSTYGRGWTARPRMLAVTQQVDANNAMAESLWSTFWAGIAPEVLRLKTMSIGRFIPAEHVVLMSSLSDTAIISVYCTTPICTWVKQDLSTPVEFEGSRVLIRAGDVDDGGMVGLDDELRVLVSHGKRSMPNDVEVQGVSSLKHRRVTTSLDRTATSLSTGPTSSAPLPYAPSLVLKPFLENPSKGQPEEPTFPHTYISEMLCMAHFVGISGPRDLATQFSKYFPGTKFVLKTLYKHRSYYSEGKEMNILQEKTELGADRPWPDMSRASEFKKRAREMKEKGKQGHISSSPITGTVLEGHDGSSPSPTGNAPSISLSGGVITSTSISTLLSQTNLDHFQFSFSTPNPLNADLPPSEGAVHPTPPSTTSSGIDGELDISQFLHNLKMTGIQFDQPGDGLDQPQRMHQADGGLSQSGDLYFDFDGGWL